MASKATVLIPTKNPGLFFREILQVILAQKTPWPFDILIIDSGSTDGTIQYCQSLETNQVSLHQISPKEFGHGKTRNLGISLCDSEFIALITHDALPANEYWLQNLVAALEQDNSIAGAFGRHLPYPDNNPFVARDINNHFDNFLNFPAIQKLDNQERYDEDITYRQFLHYFSDNNACIRRSVWQKIPYPDVDFAEDQIWAKTIIESGYAKVYVDNAAVFHSHNYSIIEYAKRSFDESKAFKELFSYHLCPTLSHLILHMLRSTKADCIYSIKNGLYIDFPSWCLKMPFLNFARQLGFYIGNKYEKLPFFVYNMLSLDKGKQHS